jgi:hypothetical protein
MSFLVPGVLGALGPGGSQVQQGMLNRLITSVVVTSYPQLTVTAPYLAPGMTEIDFDEDGVDQLPTAVGIVNSPAPYVMATIMLNLNRAQPVAAAYIAQWQANAVLGSVTIYSDSTVFPAISLSNCSLMRPTPGPYTGKDITVKCTIKGVYYVNAALWNAQ